MKMRNCEQCDRPFEPQGKNQRFCCRKCADKNYKLRKRYKIDCVGCGKVVWVKRKDARYCSRECAFDNWSEWNNSPGPPKNVRVTCIACGAEVFKADAYNATCCTLKCYEAHYTRQCVICGDVFYAKTDSHRVCSDECRIESARRIELITHRRNGKEVKCKQCGVKFCPLYGSKRRSFCSEQCSLKYAKKKYKYGSNGALRAKHYGVKRKYFDESKILKRDGWRCYICGVDTPKGLRGTYADNAPEIDHIVPLSRGGWHVKSNVACACRKCNMQKSNRTLEEYLEMVAQQQTALPLSVRQLELIK